VSQALDIHFCIHKSNNFNAGKATSESNFRPGGAAAGGDRRWSP
jgi:hypothetical protein